jgi:hypothetical protein
VTVAGETVLGKAQIRVSIAEPRPAEPRPAEPRPAEPRPAEPDVA